MCTHVFQTCLRAYKVFVLCAHESLACNRINEQIVINHITTNETTGAEGLPSR